MSAFKDAGHRWWMQCPSCGAAWPIAGAPDTGEDAEEECDLCKQGGEEGIAAIARAEGYSAAREQAVDVAYSLCLQVGLRNLADEMDKRIRAMHPEGEQ